MALFIFAPMLTFILSLLGWAVIPFGEGLVVSDLSLGLLYLCHIFFRCLWYCGAGWSSNSKYSFRDFEVLHKWFLTKYQFYYLLFFRLFNMSDVIIARKCLVGSTNFSNVCSFVSALAETNRHPFDLPEAEAEL